MGARYTVQVWGATLEQPEFLVPTVYAGNSLARALWVLWRSRRRGFRCVSLKVQG